jgi:hypothetical protein
MRDAVSAVLAWLMYILTRHLDSICSNIFWPFIMSIVNCGHVRHGRATGGKGEG